MSSSPINFLSVCSGIEAASMAWEPLGWKACAFAEIEKFPSAVLAHHWPETPNLGDMTKYNDWPTKLAPNLIVGGTPCQAFSVAGLRKGLADPRGNLTLVFLGILAQFRPKWVVWENVPGVLSDKTGAFGAFIGGLGELGYGVAYRVLDAQHFGVPQRRRRVFVVGCLGDWKRAAAVLFEPESLRGDSPPSREARESTPARLAKCLKGSNGCIDREDGHTLILESHRMVAFGEYSDDSTASTVKARDYKDATDLVTSSAQIAHTLRGEGVDASEDGTGRGTPLVAIPIHDKTTRHAGATGKGSGNGLGVGKPGDPCPTLTAGDKHAVGLIGGIDYENNAHGPNDVTGPLLKGSPTGGGRPLPAIAFSEGYFRCGSGHAPQDDGTCNTLQCNTGDQRISVAQDTAVRRLTPRECERLQGFPDDHTLIPWRGKAAENCPDGPRYKALGNSMAVPVMRWIGERISKLNNI